MAGIKALRKLQLGREATAGTAIAATTIWRGMGMLEDKRKLVFPDEDVGLVVPTDRSYVPKYEGAISMDSVEATFEQLPHILEAGIKAIGTGVADGAGTGKIYDYPYPESAVNAIKSYTIEGGDNQEVEEMEYSFVSEFNLSGKGGEAVMADATWRGRQVIVSSFTGALSIPTVEEILFSKGKLYIDAIGGTYGTTQKSSTLLDMAYKVKTGWIPKWTADGTLYFTFAKLVRPEMSLELTFEHDAISAAEKVNWRTNIARKIQLKFEGSALGTPGTVYTYKTLIINHSGKWEKFDKIDEQDGNDVIKATFSARYNATSADIGNIIVVNELATIP